MGSFNFKMRHNYKATEIGKTKLEGMGEMDDSL